MFVCVCVYITYTVGYIYHCTVQGDVLTIASCLGCSSSCLHTYLSIARVHIPLLFTSPLSSPALCLPPPCLSLSLSPPVSLLSLPPSLSVSNGRSDGVFSISVKENCSSNITRTRRVPEEAVPLKALYR